MNQSRHRARQDFNPMHERQPWQDAIDRVVDDLLDELEFLAPPIDAVASLRRLGVEVAVDSSQPARGRLKSLAGRPAVFLRPEPRRERFQWSAAHELGEVNAWRIVQRLDAFDDGPAPRLREQLANQFAARFLLPQRWFLEDARRLRADLFQLKQRYATASHELIARRLLDVPPARILTILDQGHVTARIGSHGRSVPPLTPAEKECWMTACRTGRPDLRCVEGLKLAAWPIHESDRRREIVLATPHSGRGDDFAECE
jgi:Zn-dependent peptidase ImmA (M78 family)